LDICKLIKRFSIYLLFQMSSSQTSSVRSLFPNSKTFLCAGPPGLGGRGVTGNPGKQGPPGPPGRSDTYQIPNLFGIEVATKTDESTFNIKLTNANVSLPSGNPNFVNEASIVLSSLPGFSTIPANISIETFDLTAFGFNVGSLYSTAPIQIRGKVIPSIRQHYRVISDSVNTPLTTFLASGSKLTATGSPTTVPINPSISVTMDDVKTGISQNYDVLGPSILAGGNQFYGRGSIITATSSTSSTSVSYIFDFTYVSGVVYTNGSTTGVTFPEIPSNGNIVSPSTMLQLDFANVVAQGLPTLTTPSVNSLYTPKMGPTPSQINSAASTNNLVLVLTDPQHGIYSQIQITNGSSFSSAAGTGLGLPISLPTGSGDVQALIPYTFNALAGLHESQNAAYKLVLNFTSDVNGPRVSTATLTPPSDGSTLSTPIPAAITSPPVAAPSVMSPWQSAATVSSPVNDTLTFTFNGQKVVLHVSFTKIPVGYSSNKSMAVTSNWAISVNGNVSSDNASINILDIIMDGETAHTSYTNTALFCLSSTDFATVGSIDFNLIGSQ
jgi:hypothetical protein